MKTESTVMYVLRLALILLAITAVVAAALAGINSITKPIIDQLNLEKTQSRRPSRPSPLFCPAAMMKKSPITPMPPAWFPRFTRVPTATPWKSSPPASTTPSP